MPLSKLTSNSISTVETFQAFSTGSTERMRIDANGVFLINATSPSVNYIRAEIAGALRITSNIGPAVTVSPAILSYEYPYTRSYIGDGSGYSWAFSKRSSSTTTDVMTIADNGRVTMPLQPSFMAYGAGFGAQNFSNRVIGNYVNGAGGHNIGGHFSVGSSGGTSRFTAPVAGYYMFTAGALWYGSANTTPSTVGIRLNGATYAARDYRDSATGSQNQTVSAIVYMAANDYVDAYAESTAALFYDNGATAGVYGNSNYNFFGGRLLG